MKCRLPILSMRVVLLGFMIPVGAFFYLSSIPFVSADEEVVVPISANLDTVLSITTSADNDGGILSLPITPSAEGNVTARNLFVDVSTNNITGYTMAFSMIQNNDGNTLVNTETASYTIPSLTASLASPARIGNDNNKWGFSVPRVQTHATGLMPNDTNNFNDTYTVVTNVLGSTYTGIYSPVPLVGAPLTLKRTARHAVSDLTELYYAANIDILKEPGTYQNTVVFTAVANYVERPNEPVGPCYNGEENSPCEVDLAGNYRSLVPVKYTGTSTSPEWSIADSNVDADWYDYGAGKWANAVAVKGSDCVGDYGEVECPDRYTEPGLVIEEDDILAYYVYIPRYAYEVQRSSPTNSAVCGDGTYSRGTCSNSEATEYNIVFQKASDAKLYPYGVVGDGTGACETYAGAYADCAGSNNKYWTHPTFSLGDDCDIKPDGSIGGSWNCSEVSGFWVGKFEPSELTSSTTNNNYGTNEVDQSVIIKPNVFSRRNQNVANQVLSSRYATIYQGLASNFSGTAGFANMANNRDWGAILYLATSSFGRADSSSGVRVWRNNCYSSVESSTSPRFVTGVSGGSIDEAYTSGACNDLSSISEIPVTNMYFGTVGVHASTTDNVYGIYDLYGSASELLLTNYSNGGTGRPGASGLTAGTGGTYFTDAWNQSFTIYLSTQFTGGDYTNYNYCTLNSCGGQAMFETNSVLSTSSIRQSWYLEGLSFAGSTSPWVSRGGYYGAASSGLFGSGRRSGEAERVSTYRVVLKGSLEWVN